MQQIGMTMTGNTYLSIALAVASIGVVLKIIGPLATRWHKKLESDLQRLKQGDHPKIRSAKP